MTQIAYSELTNRFYFLPMKGKKIDITDDINELLELNVSGANQRFTDFVNHLKAMSKISVSKDYTRGMKYAITAAKQFI